MKNKKEKSPLLNSLCERFEESRSNKSEAEQNILININYINGKQYIKLNRSKNVIEDIPYEQKRNYYREKEVFNRIKPLRNKIVKTLHGKIPIPYAVPITQSDEDVQTAEVTTAVLREVFRRNKLEKKIGKCIIENIDKGPAFLEIVWDKNKGEMLTSDLDELLGDQSILMSEEEKQEVKKKYKKQIMSGDVDINFVSAFEMYVSNPFEQDIQEQEWIIKAKTFSKSTVEDFYGVTLNSTDEVGELTQQPTSNKDTALLTNNIGTYSSVNTEDKVIVKEYYEKASGEHKKGRYIIFCDEMILFEGEMPYKNDDFKGRKYPFVKINYDTPNQFYSHAFIEEMKPIQRRYNEVNNRKYEHIAKTVHGQLLVENGSIEDGDAISNRPGDIIWYKRGATPPSVIHSIYNTTVDIDSSISLLDRQFTEVLGISSLTQTGTPATSGIRGANMTTMLLEQDQDRYSLIIDSASAAVVDLGEQVVRLYKQFLSDDEVRFSKYFKNKNTDMYWKRDLLIEDIEIENKTVLATTPAQRKEELIRVMQMGLFDPNNALGPAATEKILSQFTTGIAPNELPIKNKADFDKAKRENRIMSQGGDIAVDQTLDDHSIHWVIHTEFMKSAEYRKLMMVAPEIDQIFRAHIDGHKQILDKQAIAAQQAQQDAQQK